MKNSKRGFIRVEPGSLATSQKIVIQNAGENALERKLIAQP